MTTHKAWKTELAALQDVVKEDAPTNSMGTVAAIQTYDPLLFANTKKRQMLRRFKSFLKTDFKK